jgi:hypothetical protein
MTYKQAKAKAQELGILVRANDAAVQCWIDRVELAAATGKQEHIDEASRYSGRVFFASAGARRAGR